MRKRGDVSCQISSLQHKRSANGCARGAFSTCARRVHLGTNPVAAHPRVSRPIDPDRRVGATRHFDPAGPNRRRARSRPRPRPRPRPTTIPRSIAFVATAPTPIVASIVPTSSIVPSIVTPIGTPRVHRPRRRSPSAEHLVARPTARPTRRANSRTRFQPTYCFPVTCSARRDSLSADVSSTALTGHACDVFDTRGFAGATRASIAAKFLERSDLATAACAPSTSPASPSASASSANDLICAAYPSRIARSSGGICGGALARSFSASHRSWTRRTRVASLTRLSRMRLRSRSYPARDLGVVERLPLRLELVILDLAEILLGDVAKDVAFASGVLEQVDVEAAEVVLAHVAIAPRAGQILRCSSGTSRSEPMSWSSISAIEAAMATVSARGGGRQSTEGESRATRARGGCRDERSRPGFCAIWRSSRRDDEQMTILNFTAALQLSTDNRRRAEPEARRGVAHSPTRRERCGSRRRALRRARRPRAERARDVHRRDGARGCRRARVKRFSRRRAHAESAVMPHTSWGAWWPPLHAVHGGEGYDGESEITDIAFLKRKRDDAKGALRARGEPLARRSRCKHRECVSTSARMPNARSRGARTRADNPVHPARREPARVEARDVLKYLRSRERGADASKPRMQCVPRSRRPTSVMSHHLHPTRVFARKNKRRHARP